MRLISLSASTQARVASGHYTARNLVRNEILDLAAEVIAIDEALLASARKVEDLEFPLQESIADRNAADRGLDTTVRLIRSGLLTDDVNAAQKEPYILVFNKGLDYYVKAPLVAQVSRYEELIRRLNEYLPADHPVRVKRAPELESGLTSWKAAREGVQQAEAAIKLARTARDEKTRAWYRVMEATYGTLVARLGKREAEHFFQKQPRPRKATTSEEAEPTSAEPSEPAEPSDAASVDGGPAEPADAPPEGSSEGQAPV